MIAKNPKSITMFNEDFARTYNRIATRTKEIIAEEAAAGDGETEQIQLVAEDPNVKIGFNLPDGPPPADLRVEGEGSEQMDIEQVSRFPSYTSFEMYGILMNRLEHSYNVNGISSSNSLKNSRLH
jgi:cell division cycle protein 37